MSLLLSSSLSSLDLSKRLSLFQFCNLYMMYDTCHHGLIFDATLRRIRLQGHMYKLFLPVGLWGPILRLCRLCEGESNCESNEA